MLRPLTLLFGTALLVSAGPATAEDFCPALNVPAALDLTCGENADGESVVASPSSPLAVLNRLRVRQLEEPVEDPLSWLEGQMTLDTSGLDDTIEQWARHPDNPIKPEALEPSLNALIAALRSLEQLTRTGCGAPREREPGRWSMRCTYEAGVVEGVVQLDLFETEGLPVATDFRAASTQRAREFEALVNGLRLD